MVSQLPNTVLHNPLRGAFALGLLVCVSATACSRGGYQPGPAESDRDDGIEERDAAMAVDL
jgi:hypothetical protein